MIPPTRHWMFGPLAALSLATTLAAAEPSWTQWRGPGRDGFVAAADWPDGLAAERVAKRWRASNSGSPYRHVAPGGIDIRIDSVRPFDCSPKSVPRSHTRLNST